MHRDRPTTHHRSQLASIQALRTMTYDAAFAALASIAPEIRGALQNGATEQDARLQIIDRILTSVLNWPHNQIRTEVHNSQGYADYALVDPDNRYLAVLEAKKNFLSGR
jgi:predicted type IV restriction endonuclease